MSMHAPSTPQVKEVVEETPDPLINMGETSAAVKNEKRKKGLLSTVTGSRNRSGGLLANLAKHFDLGNSNI